MKFYGTSIALTLLITLKVFAGPIHIIPQPESMAVLQGQFILNRDTVIIAPSRLTDYLNNQMAPATGFDLKISATPPQSNYIHLQIIADADSDPEAYNLTSTPKSVNIIALTEAGIFYGIQTLLQLLPPEVYAKTRQNTAWTIPAVTIKDTPRFKWRGLHLDVGRHYMPVDFIKKYLDLMALHKLNTFHWHLTEDQGWRIEIKKYPKLTEISAWRDETLIGHARNNKPWKFDSKRHGGFYTQQEIKNIVQYAAERYISIVPEIEMPGHSLAAIAAYPELSCTGGPHKVATRWGIFKDVYCAGNDETFTFLQNVLDEVFELFPGKYIHVGGDECPKDRWKECAKCQARIKAENLKDEHELQSYFIKRMEKYINNAGRTLIGWDEIIEGGLSPNAAVMSWRGEKGGITAAQTKHYVIMSPTKHCYLNYYQGPEENEPLAIGGNLPLEKVYSYEPIPKELLPQQVKYILGIQGNVWTEYISTPQKAEYMAYPRVIALAEIAWSANTTKDFPEFRSRLEKHLQRLDSLNVNYRKLDK